MTFRVWVLMQVLFGGLILFGVGLHYKGYVKAKDDERQLKVSDLNGPRTIAARARVEDHLGRMVAKLFLFAMIPLSWFQTEAQRTRPLTVTGKLSILMLFLMVALWDYLAIRLERARKLMLALIIEKGYKPLNPREYGIEEEGEST